MAELLERIPVEKCWAITAKALTRLINLRVARARLILGTEEGIIAPIWGWEKVKEISNKVWIETGKKFWPYFKKAFDIPLEDAVGAAKLAMIASTLSQGPEINIKLVAATPERAIIRLTKCMWWMRAKEKDVHPELMHCVSTHQLWAEEGLNEINPNLTHKITKAMPKGDPYCEVVIELKEE